MQKNKPPTINVQAQRTKRIPFILLPVAAVIIVVLYLTTFWLTAGTKNLAVSQDRFTAYGEPSVAINPRNPANLLGAAQDINASSWPTPGTFTSFDQGKTWTDNGALPLPPGIKGGGDVSVGFTSTGLGFVAADAGADWHVNHVLVWRMADSGRSFYKPVEVSTTTSQQVDHPWLAVDTTSGRHEGTIYIVWTADDPQHFPVHSSLMISRSVDGGRTFAAQRVLIKAGSTFPALATMNISPNGSVNIYYSIVDGSHDPFEAPYPLASREVITSRDGGMTFTDPYTISQSPIFFTVGSIQMANIQAAATDPVHGNYLYTVTMATRRNGRHAGIMIWSSRDSGKSWQATGEVDGYSADSTVDCFQPQIVVNNQSTVYISYFCLDNGRINEYLAWSTSHGKGFAGTKQVSAPSFSPASGDQGRESGGWIGDYQGLAEGNGTIYPFWNDGRNGHLAIYTEPTTESSLQ